MSAKLSPLTGLICSMAMAFGLSACSWNSTPTTPDTVEDMSPKNLYNLAQDKINEGEYMRASELLLALNTRYPYGQYANQSLLDLIYCYYKDEQNTKALQIADRFIVNNPTHKDLDYVYYMRGLVLMQQDTYLLHSLFMMDRSDRDPSYAEEAFRDFNFIVERMGKSKYAADAKLRMLFLKNRLARYHLSIAQYYFNRRAYIASANRAKRILDSFHDTEFAEKALEIMIESYQNLNLPDMEAEAKELMALNFPDNRLAH